jgi:hypothetical protein
MTRRFALDVITEEAGGSLANERNKAEDLFLLAHADLESSLVAHRDLPTVGGKTDRSRIEPRLSRAVSTLVYKSQGAGVEVRCWSPREWRIVRKEWGAYIGTTDFLGFAWGETGVSIAPDACEPLVEFVYDRNRPSSGRELVLASAAIGLLAHEAQHLADNWASEAETECSGMQSLRRMAGFLGASDAYAALLAEAYWADVYPLNLGEYRTSACRNTGPLDQKPGSDVWP